MKSLSDFSDAHLRIFSRAVVPATETIHSVHLVGICGTGMGSLAGLFHEMGFQVQGSDAATWPPMSTRLAENGIPVIEGFSAANLVPHPDLTIIGNACVPTHPEATYAREQGLVQMSFPEALGHFFIDTRRSLVVAGTHGKSTTTALLVHVFREAGLDPGYLVGGVLGGGIESQAVGSGNHFIVEGDEYDSAYFDKQPKFMHYRPTSAIVTSVEFDHADIYSSLADVHQAFQSFADLVADRLFVCADDPLAGGLTHPRKVTYGLILGAEYQAKDIQTDEMGSRFTLVHAGKNLAQLAFPMHGRHNLQNALAVCAIALSEGVDIDVLKRAMGSFQGIQRRQQVRGNVAGITVVDDFAHHPTAVRATIQATREKWPTSRVLAVFEPRSNSSRRKTFERAYTEAFLGADAAFLSAPPFRHNDSAEDFIDISVILNELEDKGVSAYVGDGADALLPLILQETRKGDVILVMSNGGFGGIHQRILDALGAQETPGR